MSVRIGIDVGGTNTDAVLIDGRDVLAATKRPTTANVTDGILAALSDLITNGPVAAAEIQAVMIGTTHFTNAVVQQAGLARTAAIRLGLPATASIPPLTDWPAELRAAIGGDAHLLHGGYEFDGRLISALDSAELDTVAAGLELAAIDAVAITGVFSPLTGEQEETVANVLRAKRPDLRSVCSHQIGRIGLLERENAAVLNACLLDLAARTIDGFEQALAGSGISAPLYLSQNDGTLMSADQARRFPVLTFASGPTNSMRGAAALTGLTDAVVLDIGGTTTDAGMLVGGFPRPASFEVTIGGVRTNFRMPDVISVGLGGGSIVAAGGTEIGPTSVGYQLTTRGRIFGGETLTASDIAVAGGRAHFGEPAAVAALDPGLITTALSTIDQRVSTLIDSLKTRPGDIPVIVVGGGSVLVCDTIAGASAVLRPAHAGVANAYGAAIAQVSGEIDQIVALDGRDRRTALTELRAAVIDQAIAAGAAAKTVEVVEIDEIPLAYLPSNALRVRMKAVGDLGQ